MAKQAMAIGLQTCLGQHRSLLEDYSDFAVIVEGVEFQCHRFILASCSTFFRLLLGNEMRERSENKAVLKNIKKETFGVILNALYKGEDGLNSDNIIDVWYASHMLDISYLFEECERFVLSILNTENYIQFYHHAKMLCSKSVTSTIFIFILQNFEHFKSEQALIYMSFEEIRALVEDCNLNVSSEDAFIDAILQWINVEGRCTILEETIGDSCKYFDVELFDTENMIDDSNELKNAPNERNNERLTMETREQLKQARKEKLPILLSSARLCLVTCDFLRHLLLDPLIMSDSEAKLLVKKALTCQWKSDLSINRLLRFRKCHAMFNAMVFVKGSQFSFYSIEDKKEVATLHMSKRYTQIYALGENLFLCYTKPSASIYLQYNHYLLFDVASRKRTLIAKLYEKPGSYFLCNQNYVILFSPHETFEKHIKLQNIKSHCFLAYRSDLTIKCACIHRNHIFAFSDKDSNTQIYIYAFERNICLMKKEIPGPVENMVSFKDDESTFLLQRSGDLWVIENVGFHDFNLRKLAALWNFQWQLRGAVCFSRELVLFGEYVKGVDDEQITTSSVPGVFDRTEVVIQLFP